MKKVPLEATFTGAYKFLFGNMISIIGTMWLPVLIAGAVLAAFACSIIPPDWLHGNFTPLADPEAYVWAHLPVILLAVPALTLVCLLAGAMIKVGLLRHSLGLKTTTTFIWFSLGSNVWRMAGASLLYIFIYFTIEIAVMIAVATTGTIFVLVPNFPAPVVGAVNALVAVAGFVAGVYTIARLFFFLPAVIVAENKIGVGRAWELGKGNVWRIIAVTLMVTLPVMFILGIAVYTLLISTVVVEVARQAPQTPEQTLHFLKTLLPVGAMLAGAYLAGIFAMYGAMLGAVGEAYKAVTAKEEAQP